LVCHRNPDETVRSVDRSTALRLNTGVHAKHPGQLLKIIGLSGFSKIQCT
jgi:hypothetical protein